MQIFKARDVYPLPFFFGNLTVMEYTSILVERKFDMRSASDGILSKNWYEND